MNFFSLTGGILLCCLLATNVDSETAADQPMAKTIPLNDIWAYEMPGTRDVRDLEPNNFGPKIRELSNAEQLKKYEQSLTRQILSRLHFNKTGQKGIPGFAVTGIGTDALREALAVLSGDKKPQTSFPAGSAVYVVFFSHQCGRYVHLQGVKRIGHTIDIRYRFIPHESREVTEHFALIPVSKLPVGEFEVKIVQFPTTDQKNEGGGKQRATEARCAVCGPFSLSITHTKNK